LALEDGTDALSRNVFKGLPLFFSDFLTLEDGMEPIHCPETSVKDYDSTLRNVPEERRANQHRGGSQK
jgi:hypothetical protein